MTPHERDGQDMASQVSTALTTACVLLLLALIATIALILPAELAAQSRTLRTVTPSPEVEHVR
ncbi:hypothetical protein CQ020_08260 [Arthrobacter sp. MYb23]|nr:hypothetical protein CQ038_06960 [Arthrobacter sp. MYb51]PRB96973.1 hypothetical protein CQ020_08260 [Arthrobacter sp. MYb23]